MQKSVLNVKLVLRFWLPVRSEFHVGTNLQTKIKRSPQNKHELPEPKKTSWGRMVSRGMIPREQPTEYTTKPLAIQKTGGRGVTGRIEIRRIGGGNKVIWHMADLTRITETEPDPKVEIVRAIIKEQTRSGFLALVVGGERKRWILATDNMKPGDIIQSTREIPPIPISGKPGDSHPVGALAIGTQVCSVEKTAHEGGVVANSAGSSAVITSKTDDTVTLKMPSKREMIVNEKCLCVVGRVSNVERNKIILGKAGASRQLGIRPKSGLWMRKTGLHGRKIRGPRKPKVYDQREDPEGKELEFTVDEGYFTRKRGLTHFHPL
ncbi:large ribosomal subunit protein uL2m-like [Watersipora subatra]|uniref:large ribosomal subunit protein uL2m-like n=1 Tax=Watersipora subatra TaxID=2589382 RepID=UPI00355C22BD